MVVQQTSQEPYKDIWKHWIRTDSGCLIHLLSQGKLATLQNDRSCSLRPLLLDHIQGDIKPLINHLQFQSRFRRTDLTPVVDRFHRKRSRIAPLFLLNIVQGRLILWRTTWQGKAAHTCCNCEILKLSSLPHHAT